MNLLWGLLVICCALASADERRILLRDIPTLLFESGKVGTGFRTDPVPQMTQVGGPRMSVSRIWCKNIGWDGRRVLWECRLPDDVPAVLGDFEITCEGYERSGDPYILAGSCGIEYSLKSVPQPRSPPLPVENHEHKKEIVDESFVAAMFLLIVFIALGGVVALVLGLSSNDPSHQRTITNPKKDDDHPPSKGHELALLGCRLPDDVQSSHGESEITSSKKDDDYPISTKKQVETTQSEGDDEGLDHYFNTCYKEAEKERSLPKTQAKDVFLDKDEPTHVKPRKSAEKNSSYASLPQKDEGWSTTAMGLAAAGGYLVGRASASAAAPTRAPSSSREHSTRRRSSNNSSWFSSGSSDDSSSFGSSSSSSTYSVGSASSSSTHSGGSYSSSSAPSGFSSSSSVGGSKTR